MRNKTILLSCLVFLCFGLIFPQMRKDNSLQKKITIGMIGKMSQNPVFIASHTGAQIAAKEIGKKYNIEIVIDWQTPEVESAEAQAATIQRFSQMHADGIAISCSDANFLTSVIDSAVDNGVSVMCFDSDAPKSKRFAYYGANDYEFGKMLLKELAAELNEKGTIAVLAGNKYALNLQRRLEGIKDELKKHPNIKLSQEHIYHNIDIPRIASEKVAQVQKNNPNIKGWIFITSVALLIEKSLKWQPGEVKVVAGQAVPAELEYIKSGYVNDLIGINCFQMGYKSVEILVDKILFKRNPKGQIVYTPLTTVSKKNVDEWLINWRTWLLKESISR